MGLTTGARSVTIHNMHTKPEVNAREHWRARQKRAQLHRCVVRENLCSCNPPRLPAVITLIRVSSGQLDDDNLAGAMKHVRDAVAEWCGCGDSPSDPLTWEYAQEKCKRGSYAVRIEWREA